MIMASSSGNFKLRTRVVALFFLLFGGLLSGRLFLIQVTEHDFYSSRANRQYVSYNSKPSVATRGNIYFQEKNGSLISAATTKEGFSVNLNPSLLMNAEEVCHKIGEIIVIDEPDCLARASKKDDPSEIIAHYLNGDEAEKIRNLNLPGLGVYAEQWRFYPGQSLASQVLGFVGYEDKGNDLIGRYGVEQHYENILKGKTENLNKSNSFIMLFLEAGKEFLSTDVDNGHDIVLTIEPKVQSFLENRLAEVVEKWSAKSAGGIIIDPSTGAIIAMASLPDFDPNNYGKVTNISYFRNPLVSNIFEMGSVVKALTMAAALDADKITPETTYFDAGYLVFNNRRIENYDGKGRETVDMQTVLDESLNTGAVFAMQRLGKNDFLKYFNNYGLAQKTEVDLPNEIVGRLSNLDSSRDIEYATASFGQGIAMSPLEFTMAIASLANGGVLMKPYVVKNVIVAGGQDNITQPTVKRRVLKEETSREISKMLVKVVDEALLGGTEKLAHYSLAAKTGTAQLVKPAGEGGGYYDNEYLHSFFGYGPAFDAKFLVFLYVEKPQGVRYASHTLTQPFMEIMKFLLNYYSIPPDR